MPIDLSGVKWDGSPLDAALAAEKVDPKIADIARSIYQQESGSGKNTKTSNAGAVGGMQIIPSTFSSVADKGWDINNLEQNARAGIRYIKQLYAQAGGDPALTAAGYYGGPGGLEKARRGVAVSDPRNPKAPNTLEYGKQVASRVLDAVVPSANAAEAVDLSGVKWDAPPAGQPAAPAGNEAPGMVASAGAGLGKGFGTVMLNAQRYVGKGLGAISSDGTPGARAADWLVRDADQGISKLAAENQPYKDANPITNSVAEVGGNIVGTAPVGGLLGKAVGAAAPVVAGTRAAPVVNALSNSLATGGFRVGQQITNPLANLALRGIGGAAVGGVSAGLVDPDTAGAGALIGGALPVVAKGAGIAGNALRRAVVGDGATPEVAALAKRAADLGIDLRADQVVNSKPLNALSAALDYVPFSGKGASMNAQQRQFNTALSRTIGENTDNMAQALKNADTRLGAEFDRVLKSTPVTADNAFVDDLIRISKNAQDEMTKDQFGIISKQINNILDKVKTGDVIDADAAYNIKKTLDRLGKSNDSTLAYHSREMRSALMDALNRSLPDGGAAFAKTRQQWGNLMELEKLIPHGAEGNISAARLGNVRNIRSKDLSELADIAAQFLKARVGDSGTAQRAGIYGLLGAGTAIDPVSVGLGLTAGRGANALLGSAQVRNALMNPSVNNPLLETTAPNLLTEGMRRIAPLIPSR